MIKKKPLARIELATSSFLSFRSEDFANEMYQGRALPLRYRGLIKGKIILFLKLWVLEKKYLKLLRIGKNAGEGIRTLELTKRQDNFKASSCT